MKEKYTQPMFYVRNVNNSDIIKMSGTVVYEDDNCIGWGEGSAISGKGEL